MRCRAVGTLVLVVLAQGVSSCGDPGVVPTPLAPAPIRVAQQAPVAPCISPETFYGCALFHIPSGPGWREVLIDGDTRLDIALVRR